MKFELEEYHRGITDDQLLADLKRVALELNKTAHYCPVKFRSGSIVGAPGFGFLGVFFQSGVANQ